MHRKKLGLASIDWDKKQELGYLVAYWDETHSFISAEI
jgi:hypothetical protein